MGSFPPKDIDEDPNMGAKFVRDLYEACDDTFGEASPTNAACCGLESCLPSRVWLSCTALGILHGCPAQCLHDPELIPCLVVGEGKYTVPVFWDKKTKTIVNNECVLPPAMRPELTVSGTLLYAWKARWVLAGSLSVTFETAR